MTKQTINNGESGASVRTKLNANFTEVYRNGGAFAGSYPPGSKVVLIGDSNSNGRDPSGSTGGRPDFSIAFERELTNEGGIYHGCDIYNIACNGSQIKGWVDSIATGESAANGDDWEDIGNIQNVWGAKALNPDVIHVALGTNEQWSATFRAPGGVGSESVQLANFNTLIGWLIDNTTADLVLIIPQPIAFAAPDTFDWPDADSAAESSRIIRATYLNCDYANHPRVRLVDTHAGLFGVRVDTTTSSPDPQTGAQWYADKLHLSAIGYRRLLEYVSASISGVRHQPVSRIASTPDSELQSNAVWSETVYIQSVSDQGATAIIDVLSDPMTIIDGPKAMEPIQYALPLNSTAHYPAMRGLSQFGAINRLLTAGGTGYRKMFAYCHASGNVYSMASLLLNQFVDSTPGNWYAQITPQGQRNYAGVSGTAKFTTADIGPVTFWVEDSRYAPRLGRNEIAFVDSVYLGTSAAAVAAGSWVEYRFAKDVYQAQIFGYAMVAPSGDFCQCQIYKGSGGSYPALAPSGFNWASGSNTASAPGLALVDFAAGDSLQLSCIANGGNAKGLQLTIVGRQVNW